MTRSSRNRPLAALAGLLLAALAGRAPAADTSLAGNWKFKEVGNGSDTTLALLQIEVKDGKPTLSVLSSPLVPNLTVEGLSVSDSSVRFTFKVPNGSGDVTVYVPKGEEKPKVLRGTFQFGKRPTFTELERTDLKEIARADAQKMTPAGQDLIKVYRTPPADREAPLKEIVEKSGDTTAGYAAADMLLALRAKAAAKDDDLRTLADTMLKVAKVYGPAADKNALMSIAQTLTRAPKVSPLAVEYARKAEKGLTKDDSAETSAAVLKTLVSALRKTGKADDAKEFAATLAKLEKQLDEEFERTAVPFKVEAVARKGKSSRVALVELFTGAQCPPCVSADIAFDAAVKAYRPADVVFLEYHLHIPRPDPLTNADSEGRQKYYGNAIRGTPTAFVNGKVTAPLGGFKPNGEERYGTLSKLIDQALETEDQATLKLTVSRKGDKVEAEANVADLKKTGDKVRLRFVLIEDVAHYAGSNGQRLHHHVVRALPGGLDGFEMKEAKATQKVLVNLGDLKKGLADYLAESDKKEPFLDDDRPMELKHLRLVALIQDDDGKEILQAAQIDVPDEK